MAQHQLSQPQSDDVRSLWIGELAGWMDESYLKECFHSVKVVSTRVIRNKVSNLSELYGFVEFESHAIAEKILHSYNGTPMPRTDQTFRLNWACFGLGDRRDSGDHSIFVGDLAADVNDALLLETFKSRYPSVKAAKVVVDGTTKRSRSYGFVRFGDDDEKNDAMKTMNGEFCSSRPMRISVATPRKAGAQMVSKVAVPYQPYPVVQQVDENSNTTVFVGNLDAGVSEEDLKSVFIKFGDILYVKIPPGKSCGFVQYTTRASADEAIQKLNGTTIGQQTVRLSWGKNHNKQMGPRQQQVVWMPPQQYEVNHQWGYYAYNHDGSYGYVYPHDPSYGYQTYQGTYPQQVS